MQKTKTKKRYGELVDSMEKAQASVVGIKEAVYDHTKLLWFVLPVMFYATLMQYHDAWQGDMWAFPDYEWMLRHEWVDTVDEILGPADDDGYLLAHFYNDSEPHRHYGPEHPSHVAHIQHVLDSRTETTLLTWALNLNFLLIPSLVARYYFFWARQSLMSIFALMWLFMFAGVAQFVALILRYGASIEIMSVWAMLGIFGNLTCLCFEVMVYIELYRLRALAMFMNKLHAKMPERHQRFINASLVDNPKQQEEDDNPFSFVDRIIHILTVSKEHVDRDSTARRYNLPPKEKML